MSNFNCIKFKRHESTGGSGSVPPGFVAHALIATMGKEFDCEGFPGIAWINWATGYPATSKIFVSIDSNTGPWTEVIDDDTPVYEHSFTFPILAIDSTHWFYVESFSDGAGLETSSVLVFCTQGSVIISTQGDFLISVDGVTIQSVVSFEQIMSGFSTSVDVSHPTEDSEVTLVSDTSLTILTEVSLVQEQKINELGTNIASASVS